MRSCVQGTSNRKRAAHCKILEWQVMNTKMNSNSMERVQKQHFSFNSRIENSPSEVFLKILRSVVVVSRSCFELML